MLAVSRTLKGDRMVAFEFLRIVERDGGLVYIAQPNGRPPTEFTLTAITRRQRHVREPDARLPEDDPLHEARRRLARGSSQRRRSEEPRRSFRSNECSSVSGELLHPYRFCI